MNSGVDYRVRGPVAVITLPKRVDVACILSLRSRSERALATGSRAITVDLRAVRHIDTTTLSELIGALHRISHHNPNLSVVGADARVWGVLEGCDVEGLALHHSMNGALAHVREDQRTLARAARRRAFRRRSRALRRSSRRS
jgi:anti-anti-sigma regulatory factor